MNRKVGRRSPAPNDPSFPLYQQFLHLGEQVFAPLRSTSSVRANSPRLRSDSWTRASLGGFESRLRLVTRSCTARYMAATRSPPRYFGDLCFDPGHGARHPLARGTGLSPRTPPRRLQARHGNVPGHKVGSPAWAISFAGDEVSAHPGGCARMRPSRSHSADPASPKLVRSVVAHGLDAHLRPIA